MYNFTTPTWKQIGDMQEEIDMLHAENALKLTQILDLEEILYDTKSLDGEDGSPCWCGNYDEDGGISWTNLHTPECIKARQATEHLWKK